MEHLIHWGPERYLADEKWTVFEIVLGFEIEMELGIHLAYNL